LGINSAIGGVTAGLVRAAHGDNFWEGFVRGAAGGGVVYLGKFIGSHDFPGIGLVGRQTAALGASVTRNALTGVGTFDHLTIPLGPIRIHRDTAGTRLTVDLSTVVGTIYGLSSPGSRFDLGRSLATGAVVFQVDSIRNRSPERDPLGRAVGGAILYRPTPSYHSITTGEIMGHEIVHVIQHDFALTTLSAPLEGWLAGRLRGPIARPLRYLDLGSHALLQAIPGVLGVDPLTTPWEREAYFLVSGY
jgi:hypothetical protein